MKRVLSSILVCVLLVGALLSLASCGNTISGTYEGRYSVMGLAEYTVTYSFDGNNVEIKSQLTSAIGSLNPATVNATYELGEDEEGNKTITFNYGEAEAKDGMAEGGVALSFTEGEEDGVKYIKIGGVKYNKVN